MNNGETPKYSASYSENFKSVMRKLGSKDKVLLSKLKKKIVIVLRNPSSGKPLKNIFKNRRRVHIDPFVLVYEINSKVIQFLDFDHHDKIYKKF